MSLPETSNIRLLAVTQLSLEILFNNAQIAQIIIFHIQTTDTVPSDQ